MIKGRCPGFKDDGSDDEIAGAVAAEIERMLAREQELAEMYAADPRSAAFLEHWRGGGDPVVELVRQFGPELREAIDNPELQDAIAQANAGYLERVAGEKRLVDEFGANMAQTLAMIEEKGERESIPPQVMEQAWEWLRSVADDGIRGIVSEEAIDMALAAITHDEDVARAAREGEVQGRNCVIEQHLRCNSATDGTIAPNGSGGALKGGRKLPPMGVLDNMERFKAVW